MYERFNLISHPRVWSLDRATVLLNLHNSCFIQLELQLEFLLEFQLEFQLEIQIEFQLEIQLEFQVPIFLELLIATTMVFFIIARHKYLSYSYSIHPNCRFF